MSSLILTQDFNVYSVDSFQQSNLHNVAIYHIAKELADKALGTSNPLGNLPLIALNLGYGEGAAELATSMVNRMLTFEEKIQTHELCECGCRMNTYRRGTAYDDESFEDECPACGASENEQDSDWDARLMRRAEEAMSKRLFGTLAKIVDIRPLVSAQPNMD